MSYYKYLYLHGFASSSFSKKGQYLANYFLDRNLNLELIDLNQNDFTNLTLSRQIEQVGKYITDNK